MVIELDINNSCPDCKYYTDTIGEKGYCRLYRHKISTPEVMCPKFEHKEVESTKDNGFDIKAMVSDFQKNIKTDHKTALNKALLLASIFGCGVFTVLAIIFAVIIGTTVVAFAEVDNTTKTIFIVTVCLFLLSVLILTYMLVHRFVSMRIVCIVASFLSVFFMLINNSAMWFNFHDLILNLLETVFNIVY